MPVDKAAILVEDVFVPLLRMPLLDSRRGIPLRRGIPSRILRDVSSKFLNSACWFGISSWDVHGMDEEVESGTPCAPQRALLSPQVGA